MSIFINENGNRILFVFFINGFRIKIILDSKIELGGIFSFSIFWAIFKVRELILFW